MKNEAGNAWDSKEIIENNVQGVEEEQQDTLDDYQLI